MKILAVLLAAISLCASSPSQAEDDAVAFARLLLARDYDASLPAQPVEQWIASVLPRGTSAAWGAYITDCGEQAGDPTIDRARDIPMCAEIELQQNGRTVGSLLLIIGTQRKGVRKDRAALYAGSIPVDGKTVWIRKLGELSRMQ